MRTAEARVDADVLDLVQEARGRVPIEEFRLLVSSCGMCAEFAQRPATRGFNDALREHIVLDHSDLIEG